MNDFRFDNDSTFESGKNKANFVKICETPGCGEEIPAYKLQKNPNQKYCCKHCHYESKRLRPKEISCVECGAMFAPKRKESKYCSQQCRRKNLPYKITPPYGFKNLIREETTMSVAYNSTVQKGIASSIFPHRLYMEKPREKWNLKDIQLWFRDEISNKGMCCHPNERICLMKLSTLHRTYSWQEGKGMPLSRMLELFPKVLERYTELQERFKWKGDFHFGQILSYWSSIVEYLGLVQRDFYEDLVAIPKSVLRQKNHLGRVRVHEWWRVPRSQWSTTTNWCYLKDTLEYNGVSVMPLPNGGRSRRALNTLFEEKGVNEVSSVIYVLPTFFVEMLERFKWATPFRVETFVHMYKSIEQYISYKMPNYKRLDFSGNYNTSHVCEALEDKKIAQEKKQNRLKKKYGDVQNSWGNIKKGDFVDDTE